MLPVSPHDFMFLALIMKKLHVMSSHVDTHLIVAITGDLDACLPHLHVHNQTFHHRQRVLVVTEVLRQG